MSAGGTDFRDKARAMLVRDEGLKLRAYQDSVGRWAVGVGYDLVAHGWTAAEVAEVRRTGITKEQALAWLDRDIDTAEAGCGELFGQARWAGWSETRRLGWLNFVFNLGAAKARTFRRTLLAVDRGDWAAVRAQLEGSLWARQVKARAGRVMAAILDEMWLY